MFRLVSWSQYSTTPEKQKKKRNKYLRKLTRYFVRQKLLLFNRIAFYFLIMNINVTKYKN